MTTRMVQHRGPAAQRPTLLVAQLGVDTDVGSPALWLGTNVGNQKIWPPVVTGMAAISGTPASNQLSYWVNSTDIAGLPGVEYDAANSRLQLANTYGLSWDGRTVVTSPDAGLLRVTNTAGNDSAGIVFGPTTIAFPRLKRSGDGLHVRLANDSDWAPISAGAVIGEEVLQVAERASVPGSTTGYGKLFAKSADKKLYFIDSAGTQIELGSGDVTGSGADGQLTFWTSTTELSADSDGLYYSDTLKLLQFGGTTSSFPALKQVGTTIACRTANDAALAGLSCGELDADTMVRTPLVEGQSGASLSLVSTGTFRFSNTTLDDVGLVTWGGLTGSYPAWARSGASFEARLADNSAGTGVIVSTIATPEVTSTDGVSFATAGDDAIVLPTNKRIVFAGAASEFAIASNGFSLSLYGGSTSAALSLSSRISALVDLWVLKTTQIEHRLFRSSTALDDTVIGDYTLHGYNDAVEQIAYGRIRGTALTVADGAEDGSMVLSAMSAGALTDYVTLDGEADTVTVTGSIVLDPDDDFVAIGGTTAVDSGLWATSGTLTVRNGTNTANANLTAGSVVATSNYFTSIGYAFDDRFFIKPGTVNGTIKLSAYSVGDLVALVLSSSEDATTVSLRPTGTHLQVAVGNGTAPATLSASTLVEAVTDGVGSPNVLTANETSKLVTNEGATALSYTTLPAAAAGLTFSAVCQDSDGIRLLAAAGDTIRVAGSATPTAGYIETTTVGDAVKLVAINATEWIAVNYVGTWTVST